MPIDAQQKLLHELRRSYTFSAAELSAYLCNDLASARDRFGAFLFYFDEHPQGNAGLDRKAQDELERYLKHVQTERSISTATDAMIALQYGPSSGKPLDVTGAGCRFTMDWSQRLKLLVVDDNQRGRIRAKLILGRLYLMITMMPCEHRFFGSMIDGEGSELMRQSRHITFPQSWKTSLCSRCRSKHYINGLHIVLLFVKGPVLELLDADLEVTVIEKGKHDMPGMQVLPQGESVEPWISLNHLPPSVKLLH